MAAQLPNDSLIISIERDSKSAEIAHTIHEHAGVSNRIKIIVDSTENVIPRLNQQYHFHSFDFIFIDHYGEAYLRDFMLLEQYGLIRSGTMIVADNVIYPGAPNYLNYIKNNPNYITKTYESTLEYHEDVRDGVEVSGGFRGSALGAIAPILKKILSIFSTRKGPKMGPYYLWWASNCII
jgi:catechol O-methyltransferase